MAWTTPLTAVANTALTAAQWNLSVRDNLLETPAAKATAANRIFVTTGSGAIAERRIVDDIVETSETTTSTTYDDLTTIGPQIASLNTGTKVFVWINCTLSSSVTTNAARASFEVAGASTITAIDGRSIASTLTTGIRCGVSTLLDVTAGNNTFTMKYKHSGGTGTFSSRRLQVMSL